MMLDEMTDESTGKITFSEHLFVVLVMNVTFGITVHVLVSVKKNRLELNISFVIDVDVSGLC